MRILQFTENSSQALEAAKNALANADAILVGAGAGLSLAAGYAYSGKRFTDNFADFIEKYNFSDLYTAGFYSFPTLAERWAFWSRHIYINRYKPIPDPGVFMNLQKLIEPKDHFILTTNVDHCFQRMGFAKERLFYTQGDYGLWQCSVPCHAATYDNEEIVRKMVAEQSSMVVPPELIPYCPRCGAPMTMNLRIDHTFVEDEGWHKAANAYRGFCEARGRMVLLELGVGENTPVIIKYPFWEMTERNPQATLISINLEAMPVPAAIAERTISIKADIGKALAALASGQSRES